MKSTRFAYLRPTSVDEAIGALRTHGADARLLAGGQSLLAEMNRRQVRPRVVVDLGRLHGLRFVRREEAALRIGALTTHHTLATTVPPAGFAVLAETARLIGHLPVRTRGTLGGSLAQAEPRAQWCLVAVLLDAVVTVRGAAGTRTLPVRDLLAGAGRTTLRQDEVLLDVLFPHPEPTAAVVEFALQEGNLPLVSAAAAVRLRPDGTVAYVKAAVGGIADRPVRLPSLESALRGARADENWEDRVRTVLAAEPAPPSDAVADGSYRREVASVVLLRALKASLDRSGA